MFTFSGPAQVEARTHVRVRTPPPPSRWSTQAEKPAPAFFSLFFCQVAVSTVQKHFYHRSFIETDSTFEVGGSLCLYFVQDDPTDLFILFVCNDDDYYFLLYTKRHCY